VVDALRLVMVTRRFWPLMGGPQKVMAEVAVELSRGGCGVMILTARWRAHWPEKIRYHEVPVVRLAPPPDGGWNGLRFVRSLRRWLRENRDRYDLVYVSRLQHDARAAIRAVGGRVPVVLRAESAGRFGDCLWQIDSAAGRRIKQTCLKAAALVAPTASVRRELQAAGYPRDRIHFVHNAVCIPPKGTLKTKLQGRSLLAEANDDLRLPGGASLAVYAGRFEPDRGLEFLLHAWKQIAGRRPNARLWLLGDGPHRAALRRQIERLELTARVVLAGVFDRIEPLLAAADLCIVPAAGSGLSMSLLEAMAAGLPVVAADTPEHRAVVAGGRDGLLVPPADPKALAAAVDRLLDDPGLAARLGTAARRRAAEEFALEKMADRHLTLFEQLIYSRATDDCQLLKDHP